MVLGEEPSAIAAADRMPRLGRDRGAGRPCLPRAPTAQDQTLAAFIEHLGGAVSSRCPLRSR